MRLSGRTLGMPSRRREDQGMAGRSPGASPRRRVEVAPGRVCTGQSESGVPGSHVLKLWQPWDGTWAVAKSRVWSLPLRCGPAGGSQAW